MRKMLISALQKKMGAGSDSFLVLIYQFKRQYPLHRELANRITETEKLIGSANEPNKQEIISLVHEIESI